MSEGKIKWGFKAYRLSVPFEWSLGVCLSHIGEETYLFINLIFFTVCAGRLRVEVQE